MRLRLLKIEKSVAGGGLFDGAEIWFGRDDDSMKNEPLAPLCIVGPNGSGKSQFLQLIAEIFQAAWKSHAPNEERGSANDEVLFELEYLIAPTGTDKSEVVRLVRTMKGKKLGSIQLVRRDDEVIEPEAEEFGKYLPSMVIGYTSGDNETLSLPFLASRSGYAEAVRTSALEQDGKLEVLDNRFMLIDYGTNLEVLFANLMLGPEFVRSELLSHVKLQDLASCRCVVSLAHPAVRSSNRRKNSKRKGVQLTNELEEVIERLQRIATCWHMDEKNETYTFDFFITPATREAFGHFWDDAFSLYRSLHKLALLNDLAIPKKARERLDKAVKERRFATRLPEPQKEDLVFGFAEVRFRSEDGNSESVDYVSLSDGEHQQVLILGAYAMVTNSNAVFLLDEPESHFNPKWRVKFVKRLMDMTGDRQNQEVLLTTHAPFVPSDMPRDQVMIFSRDPKTNRVCVEQPEVETFGANFDRILDACFDVRPPISKFSNNAIDELLDSNDLEFVERGFQKLGASTEKALVASHLRKLKAEG
jgi:restriction system-associated AAA family ATPase